MSLLELHGMRKSFGATLALDGVDVFIEAGEVHALVGENGSGKSTLMRVAAGVLAADAGAMRLDGTPYAPASPLDARRRGVAMVHQELALCPDLSVAENILLGNELTVLGRVDAKAQERVALEALSTLGHGDLSPRAKVAGLPIGLCQIVEIARAVVAGARVLILDEPTSSLSGTDVERLFQVLRALRDSGTAIVYISHFLEEIEAIADRVTVLRDGQRVATRLSGELTQAEIVSLMVGRELQDAQERRSRTPGRVLLEVHGLGGDAKPLDASLELREGEVLGIAGLNGSGRTELIRCLFGLDPVRSGQIRIGQWQGWHSPARRWAQKVGMLSEDRKQEGLLLERSIEENLTLPRTPAVLHERRQAQTAQQWIEGAGIKARGAGQPVGELSGGNQQKVAFARLLANDVDVLLLDEPTRGIDVASKAHLYRMIRELADRGKAVLVVSSYLPELLSLCDRIAVMRRGRLGEARPVTEWDQEHILREATMP